jgi:hypothetical protein
MRLYVARGAISLFGKLRGTASSPRFPVRVAKATVAKAAVVGSKPKIAAERNSRNAKHPDQD